MNILQLIKSKFSSYISNLIEKSFEEEDEDMSRETKIRARISRDASTEDLLLRLKYIANDTTEYSDILPKDNEVKIIMRDNLWSGLSEIPEFFTDKALPQIAMCYSPAPEYFKKINCKCVICNKELEEIHYRDYTNLIKTSSLIKSSQIAQIKIVCGECLIEMCLSNQYRYNIQKSDLLSPSETIDLLKSLSCKYYTGDKSKYYIVVLFKQKDVEEPHLAITADYYHLEYLLSFLENRWFPWGRPLREYINIIEQLTGLKLTDLKLL